MKFPLLLLVLLVYNSSNAATYYLSTSLGDDSRSSAQAQNQSTPWKSIAKLNTVFGALNPGDSILLKRNDTFYGTLLLTKSGTSLLPIVISSYGTGNKPLISGLTNLSGWVSAGNGIWETVSPEFGNKENIILINDAYYPMGRYPNADASNKGYLTYESCIGNTQITDNQLTSSPDWTGAEVVIRKVHGVIDRNLITAHSGNTIYYTSASGYYATNNFGYFIQNDIKTLDQVGEWYFSPSLKKISVYLGPGTPTSYTIQASSLTNLININSQKYISISELSLKGANVDAIVINGAQNINFKNCDISFSGESAIKASYTTNLKVDACNISGSNNNGIDLFYNDDNAVITNNLINNTSLFNGMVVSGDGNGNGINVRGKANSIEYNQITNTGYNGISFSDDDNVMTHNFISNFCLIKDDGGGLYTFVGSNTNLSNHGRQISKNIILNGLGSSAGTDDPAYLPAHGIFLDDNASGIEIFDNTIANNSTNGIFFHNAHDINLRSNTFYNNGTQLYMRDYEDPYSDVRNNVVTNNILFSKLSSQWLTHNISVKDNIGQFAKFDSNYYSRPLDDNITILNDYVYNSGNNTKSDAYDLNGWKLQYSQDAASKKSAKVIPAYTINGPSSINKFTNGNFNTDIGYINCWTPGGNCTTSWNSGGKLDSGAMQIAFTSPVVSNDIATVSIPLGSISGIKNYILKFSMLGSVGNKSVALYLRDNDSYNKLSPVKYQKITTSRSELEVLFQLPEGANNAGLIFEFNDQFNSVWLDNIQFSETEVSVTNPDDYFRFEVNPTASAKTIFLEARYLDSRDSTYSGSVTLNPYSSIVLIKTGLPVPKSQTITFSPLPDKFYGDLPFTVRAAASSGLPVGFKILSGPATLQDSTVTLTGTGVVTVQASQVGDSNYDAAQPVSQSFMVKSAPVAICNSTGTIIREQWSNIPGWSIASIPLQLAPTFTTTLTSLESKDVGELYGARIRGYICAPLTGYYNFWVAGDDVLELWLSVDDNLANKVKIATTNYTSFEEYNKYPSQKSELISLKSGVHYYVEVLQKEGGGGGHSSVAWTLPGGKFQAPIPGSQLSPYTNQTFDYMAGIGVTITKSIKEHIADTAAKLTVYPNPLRTSGIVQFSSKNSGKVDIGIYDLKGILLKQLFSGNVQTNMVKSISFLRIGIPQGTYIVRMITSTTVLNQKIIIL